MDANQQDESPSPKSIPARSPASSIVLLLVGLFLGWLVGGGGKSLLNMQGPDLETPRENFVASVDDSVPEIEEYEPPPLPEVTLRMKAPETMDPPLRAKPLPPREPEPKKSSPPPPRQAPPAPPPPVTKPRAPVEPIAAKNEYPRAEKPSTHQSPTTAPKQKKPAPQLRIPEPGYPVFQAERIPTPSERRQGQQSQDHHHDLDYAEADPDEEAYPTFAPQVFIRGQTGVPYATVEFELSKDGSFYVSIIQGTGVAQYDDVIIDTLRDWKWQPATRKGRPIDSVERVRLRSVSLPLEEWERQRRQAGR